MSFNARLFNAPKLRRIVEITDSINDLCNLIADALADYESADDLPASEQVEARNEARENAWTNIGELLAYADDLRIERDQLAPTE